MPEHKDGMKDRSCDCLSLSLVSDGVDSRGHLTSTVSVCVSSISWMFSGITPSAGTRSSISSGTASFGRGGAVPRKLDMFDL